MCLTLQVKLLVLMWQKLCFEENDQINITEYTQIAMLTVEVALLKVLEEMGYRRMWRQALVWGNMRPWRQRM